MLIVDVCNNNSLTDVQNKFGLPHWNILRELVIVIVTRDGQK